MASPKKPTVDTESEEVVEVVDFAAIDPERMPTVGIVSELNVLDSKKSRDVLTDTEYQRLQRLEEELNRRTEAEKPSHYHVGDEGATPSVGREGHSMTTFDPAAIGGMDNVIEPKAVPPGEYKLAIIGVRSGVTAEAKGAKNYWQPQLEIVGEPHAKDFTHFLFVPDPRHLTPKQFETAKWRLNQFMQCFGLDYSRPFTPAEDWIGAEGWAVLDRRSVPTYGLQNSIEELILPK